MIIGCFGHFGYYDKLYEGSLNSLNNEGEMKVCVLRG